MFRSNSRAFTVKTNRGHKRGEGGGLQIWAPLGTIIILKLSVL